MKKRINIAIEHGEPVFFSDSVAIIHNPSKFILDFKQATPRVDQIGDKDRQSIVVKHKPIMMDVEFAKNFLKTLEASIKKYEKQFGKIKASKRMEKQKKSIASADTFNYIG